MPQVTFWSLPPSICDTAVLVELKNLAQLLMTLLIPWRCCLKVSCSLYPVCRPQAHASETYKHMLSEGAVVCACLIMRLAAHVLDRALVLISARSTDLERAPALRMLPAGA